MKINMPHGKTGFTLIELIVVIALISLILFIAFPRFQRGITDPARAVSMWLLLKVPELKQAAMDENHLYVLNIDMGGNKLWITNETMNDTEKEQAVEAGYVLPDGARLLNVEFPNTHIVSSGVAQILFYPKGYSDRAIIHLKTNDEKSFSYIIESFLSKITIVDANVGFVD